MYAKTPIGRFTVAATALVIAFAVVTLVVVHANAHWRRNQLVARVHSLGGEVEFQGTGTAWDYFQIEVPVEVILSNCQIADADMEFLTHFDVVRLHLEETSLSEEAFERLSTFSHLEELYLYKVPVSKSGMAIPNVKSLQRLWLEGQKITDEVATSMSRLRNLRRLDIQRAVISDRAAGEIAKLGNLELINAAESQISDTGFREFASLPSLKVIRLIHPFNGESLMPSYPTGKLGNPQHDRMYVSEEAINDVLRLRPDIIIIR